MARLGPLCGSNHESAAPLAGSSPAARPAILATVMSLACAFVQVHSQAPVLPAPVEAPLRTPWGDPDLQGVWTNKTLTPLERPEEFGSRRIFTEEEAAAREEDAREARRRPPAPDSSVVDGLWWHGGTVLEDRRASLIVDPPDGRVPALPPVATQRIQRSAVRGAAAPEDRHPYERCIIRHSLPEAMSPAAYNSNYEIFQTPGYLAIHIEMVALTRIIPLDGRPHISPRIRQWKGDSRGRWEGDTLLVETTNLVEKTNYFGSGEHLRLIERFRRLRENLIDYRFTAIDPTTFTQPWTVAMPLIRQPGRVYEYACHEGNRAMLNVLAGARAGERGGTR